MCGAGRKALPRRETIFLDEDKEKFLLYKVKAVMCV